MATALTQTVNNDGRAVASWSALTENETGDAARLGQYKGSKTVEITVNAQAGESVTIQGSNDQVTWFTLRGVYAESDGTFRELTGLTASGQYLILENPAFVRPVMSNVGGSGADFDVTISAPTK